MKASRLLIAAAVTALVPLSGAFAQTAPPAQTEQPAEDAQKGATFESLDTNSDGRISKDEAAVNTSVSQQFSKYDKNGNGYIEKEEVGAANPAPAEAPKQP